VAGLSVRAWRALVCIAFAVIVVAVAAVPYLGWMPHSSASGRPSALYAVPDRWRLLLASFGDGAHGVVVMTQTSLISDTYMTANAGRTWQARHVGISGTTFLDRNHAIALESQPETQLVSTANAGRTWMPMSTPVMVQPVRLLLDRVSGGPVFIDPAHGWWLENRSPAQPLPVGLWRTRDGGRTWLPLSATGLSCTMQLGQVAFVDPTRGAILCSSGSPAWPSLMTTRDGGETWASTALQAPPTHGLSVPMTAADAVQLLRYAGRLLLSFTLVTSAGDELTRWASSSEDGGLTWTTWAREPDIVLLPFAAPLFDERGRLLLADDHLLWTSSDDARTWQARALNLPHGARVLSLVAARAGALFIVAERQLSASARGVALFRSLDGGDHWTEIHLPHEAGGAGPES
jgi:photosystem II stability/assembly factor-like uncharacterized protein